MFRKGLLALVAVTGGLSTFNGAPAPAAPGRYEELVTLFAEWRTFQKPTLLNPAS